MPLLVHQNPGKKQFSAAFYGKGAKAHIEELLMLARASTFPGRLQKVIKHFGGLWDSKCTATPEISVRLEKAMKVWRMFIRVWHATIVWMRNKIIFFRALVLSSLLSGLEAV
eukprot:9636215-Heterocapsa_arctica.AAC.1